MSLKQILLDEIKAKGTMMCDELNALARMRGYNENHAQARLRDLRREEKIVSLWNTKKTAIIGYAYAGKAEIKEEVVTYDEAVKKFLSLKPEFGNEAYLDALKTRAKAGMKNTYAEENKKRFIYLVNRLSDPPPHANA